MEATRGIRNNNPGNIRHGDNWDGLAKVQPDPAFCLFKTPEYGIRAMARVLTNYQRRHGIKTVRGIITRWAPPKENDTAAYVDHVAQVVGVDPDQPLVVTEVLPRLIPVIIKHENGQMPYSDDQIATGIRMATT
ncbi:structural protein [Desulfoluna spongiiphila]|uniref:structural protein n=1 Tax=Desulfoluna spongiiphila TaxID=419481 RepID=UPI00125440FA|nr:structural protein [Desulfoluna spongiiphila]VVS90782.1 consensus disorder prediction [Desulfoluna spongiiphila]